MGIYHNISNETKQEFIDPAKVKGGANKEGFVINCGRLVLWLMTNRWHGDHVIVNKDVFDHYFDVEQTYKDITLDSIEVFNRDWPGEL